MIASMTFIIRYHWKKINFNNGTFPKTSNEAFLMLDIYSMHLSCFPDLDYTTINPFTAIILLKCVYCLLWINWKDLVMIQ